jgi:hypothetical protein
MNKKELYIILDDEGDIVETFPLNSNFDYMFQIKQANCPNGSIHKATLIIGEKESERIQINSEKAKATKSIKNPTKKRCRLCDYEFDGKGLKVFMDDPDNLSFCTIQCMDLYMQKNDF